MSNQSSNNIFRPNSLDEFFGQKNEIKKLKIYLYSAKKRKSVLDHMIFYGPPGCGKTSLAYIVANEMKTNILTISASSLEKTTDIISIFGQINDGDILFIDEIHRLDKEISEIIYSALEDFKINISFKTPEGSKGITLNISPFTLIGATTDFGKLSIPFRTRFPIILKFDYYLDDELAEIVIKNAKKINIEIEYSEALEIAKRSRKTPRIAINNLKRIYDFCFYKKINHIDQKTLKEAFKYLNIYENGLNKDDIQILNVFKNYYNNGPVSLESIASILNDDVNNIKVLNEPFLVSIGYIKRTRKGRILAKEGEDFLNKNKEILKEF